MRRLLLFVMLAQSFALSAQEEGLITAHEDIPEDQELSTLDLNTTDAATLRQLTTLSEQKIQAFLNYRENYGMLISPAELQVIRQLTDGDIREILKVFYVTPHTPDMTTPASPGHLLLRVRYDPIAAGQMPGRGSPVYRMARVEYRKRRYALALVIENDPGESLRWNPTKHQFGPDHISGYYVRRFKRGHTLIAGNFTPHFAQGLQAGGGFSLGKGRNTVAALAGPGSGTVPNRSLREGGMLTGISFSSQESRIRYGLYTGMTSYDATVYGDNGDRYLHSFQFSGYHRSRQEQLKRKAVKRLAAGAYLLAPVHPNVETGLLLQLNRLSIPMRARKEWYDTHSWEGRDLLLASAFVRVVVKQWYGWIELAASGTGKTALQAAILVSMGRRWSAGILFRDYKPGYFSFDARAFGERTAMPENEKGIYLGLTYTPMKRWTISAFADMYRFPWLTYDISTPSYGSEYFIGSTRQFSSRTTVMAEFRLESRLKNLPSGTSGGQRPGRYLTRQTGLFLKKTLTDHLEWRFRFRWKKVIHGTDNMEGLAVYNELILSHRPWTISYRLTRFHTDAYLSRIYFYERDLWGSFTLPSYQGNGLSQYVLLRYALSRKVDLWFRYAVNSRQEANNTGESMKAIKKLVSCQVRIKF